MILKLDGPMQAWGGHTFEDYRPTNIFPTRSGILGLLGACLGLDRSDQKAIHLLGTSIEIAVRADLYAHRPERNENLKKEVVKLPDYHTVLEARRVGRRPKEGETIQSWREYLFNASFTVALKEKIDAAISLASIAEAVNKPVYTPFLGRRSCPLARPLFEKWQDAEDCREALDKILPNEGVIFMEVEPKTATKRLIMRDVPMHETYPHRRFGTRTVFVLS
ncbi:MAG: type I-E CRISPR-associated protein Cas5/CasD [Syntrophales bacterium]|nr:type I-E CRISPR-associated protein Cas5/CasD [Syntrophales bacterium]